MYSIGQMSQRTGVKVPTIRYYEQMGLLPAAGRSAGNQRRYNADGLARLSFIRHARDLGFTIEAISALLDLQDHPDRSCGEVTDIAKSHLKAVRSKLERLHRLERELQRLTLVCSGEGTAGDCDVLAALADHGQCAAEH